MKKQISAKLFFTVLGRGIAQAFRSLGRLFGFRDGSRYALVVRRIFTGSCAVIALIFATAFLYMFADEVVWDEWLEPRFGSDYISTKPISNRIAFRCNYHTGRGDIYDRIDDKVLMRRVDWVITSDDRDSLAVFAKNGKRGYINRYTGEVAIPLRYNRAWIFSEGLAAVELDGRLCFIDHTGQVVIDRGHKVCYADIGYAFRQGYCVMWDSATGKAGLIDRSGDWVLKPEYDYIATNEGFWCVGKEERYGLYTEALEPMFPVENTNISICDGTITVRHADHIARQYDYAGNMLNPFLIDGVESMMYETSELRTSSPACEDCYSDEIVSGIANRLRYCVSSENWHTSDYYGLLSRDGRIVTQPLYTSIQAIAPDRYLCQPDGVILDDQGRPVN